MLGFVRVFFCCQGVYVFQVGNSEVCKQFDGSIELIKEEFVYYGI